MSFLTITQRLARSFDEVPNNAAVWARGKSLSYREFGDRSARIATLLRKNGVGRGDRVAILSHRVDSMYISVAGVLLAGATYVALNPRFPSLRNKLILAESEAKALLIEERCAFAMGDATLDTPALKLVLFPDAEMVTPIPGKKVCGRQSLNFSTDALDPDLHACGSDLVYIVFTSGTTGKPKGVQITHSNLISYVDNINSFVGATTPDDRVVQIVDLTFDVSAHDMFTAWSSGATVISIPENAALMAGRFVQEHEITQWFSVPSTARLLKEAGLLEAGCFPSIRSSIFAGEPLVSAVAEAWQTATSNAPVYNIYGPTEGTISLCGRRYSREDFESHEVVSLGAPFRGNEMALFHPGNEEPVPASSVGEICFTGCQVTPGYWRDDELNATRFFKDAALRTWYRTGDLGRQDPVKGFLFVGRVDHQVKIRGYRVELSEIELTIRGVTSAVDVAVIPWPLSSDGNAMGCVAFIAAGSEAMDAQDIRDFCANKLPDYMIPSKVVFLDSMPLNSNGKTDYGALKQHSSLSGSKRCN